LFHSENYQKVGHFLAGLLKFSKKTAIFAPVNINFGVPNAEHSVQKMNKFTGSYLRNPGPLFKSRPECSMILFRAHIVSQKFQQTPVKTVKLQAPRLCQQKSETLVVMRVAHMMEPPHLNLYRVAL